MYSYSINNLLRIALINSLLIIISSLNNLYAQTSKDIENLETEAKYYFDKRNYYQALPLYLKLDSLKPEFPNYIYPLGICYMNSSYNEEEALKYLLLCNKDVTKYPSTIHYYLGKAYHLSNDFESAIAEYNKYLSSLYHSRNKNTAVIKDINRQIQMCENGKQFIKTPLSIDVTNMGSAINSAFADYGPVLSADEKEIIFTSSRFGSTGGLIDPYDGAYHEDVYIAVKKDSMWTPANNIGTVINTNGHDASISLTPDGQQLLIYRFNSDLFLQPSDGILMLSQLDGAEWTEPKKLLGEVNSKAYEPSACLIKDGRSIIFSSNREGGYGGLDLYIAKKLANGEWAKPMNLGSSINTPYDEDSPFLHPDGQTLYFSSTGHNSMGGFDMFYAKCPTDSLNRWDKPLNLGYPLNTGHDEIHFVLSPDGKKIYFSSIRKEGFGDKDIYYATVENTEVKDVLVIVGVIQDSISKAPVDAKIEVFNTENNELIGIYNSNKTTGKYIMVLPEGGRFKIIINSDTYKVCDDYITTKELNGYHEIESNINLCPESIK